MEQQQSHGFLERAMKERARCSAHWMPDMRKVFGTKPPNHRRKMFERG